MKIFLIEDDTDDVELLEEALKANKIIYEIDVAKDGSAAVEYVKSGKVNPDVIVLDFNLPKIHGRDVLIEIKSVSAFKNIPLLILTTSSAKEDIEYSYKHGANKYLIKPTSIKQIKETVDVIVELAKKSQ
ncbi:MAG: response regulator [Flavipsychrobacter sp.]|nr:response regulator [Flavipsychrobacter sp.]